MGVYPNPASSYITLELKDSGTMEMYSVEGRLITREERNRGVHQKNIKNLPSGICLVRFIHKGGAAVQRLVEE